MKSPRLSRVKHGQDLSSRSMLHELENGESESEYEIKFSPTRYHKTSQKRLHVQGRIPSKKPMLVEISNIKSVFNEKKNQSPKRNSRPSFLVLKKLYEQEKFPKNHCHKRFKPGSFNLQDMEMLFQSKNQCSSESLESYDNVGNIISDCSPCKIHSSKIVNTDKSKNFSEIITNNSFSSGFISKKANSIDLIENNFNPLKVKPSKMSWMFLAFDENERQKNMNNFSNKNIMESVPFKNAFHSSDFVDEKSSKCGSSIHLSHVAKRKDHNVNYSKFKINSAINDCLTPELVEASDLISSPTSEESTQSSEDKKKSDGSVNDNHNPEQVKLSILISSSESGDTVEKFENENNSGFIDKKSSKCGLSIQMSYVAKKKSHNISYSKFKTNSAINDCSTPEIVETSNLISSPESKDSTQRLENKNKNDSLIIDDYNLEKIEISDLISSSESGDNFQKFENENKNLKCFKRNVISKNAMNNSNFDDLKTTKVLSTSSKRSAISQSFLINDNFSDLKIDFSNLNYEEFRSGFDKSSKISVPKSISNVKNFDCDNEVLKFEDKFSLEGKRLVFDNRIFMKNLPPNKEEKSSSSHKGSSWVQSLNWTDASLNKEVNCENTDLFGKRIIKNIVRGGFAEQMLKLLRKERSDKVIWNHKINEIKKKVANDSKTFILASILHVGQIVFTKCYSSQDDVNSLFTVESHLKSLKADFKSFGDNSCDTILQEIGINPFIVLFKREILSKLHLKIGDMFVLYPPWQMLSGTTFPFPVFLCTYYAESLSKSVNIPHTVSRVPCQPVTYYSRHTDELEWQELKLSDSALSNSLDLYGRYVCLAGRVQRIWKRFISNNTVRDMLKTEGFLGYSLLLQNREGIFFEFKINSSNLPLSYEEYLSGAEGLAFKFCDVIFSHRCNLNKCPELFKVIEHIQKNTKNDRAAAAPQAYYYQFIPSSFSKVPCKISDESFPAYCGLEIKPLSFIQKECLCGTRVSCIGKILFQNKDDFFISDESLLSSKLQKFFRLKFDCHSQLQKLSIIGAAVLIKEAVISEGYLLVDKFSSCTIISNAAAHDLFMSYQSRLKRIGFITPEHVLLPLSLASKLKDLVLVKGIITEVDDNTAISWLECSQCSKENLLEDSSSVIYCEDCSSIVSKPVLKVRMEAVITSVDLYSAEVKVQLQSSTIKRILNISEDDYKPQCNISDVYKKDTGVLICCVKDIQIRKKQKVFCLTEIITG